MKSIFYAMSIAVILMLSACGDSSTNSTSDTTKGELYGFAGLFNEYQIQLADQSGLNVQLIEDGKVVQSVTTSSDGMFSFKDVSAGVYSVRFFKSGYVCIGLAVSPDTTTITNIQFVGKGKYEIENKSDYNQFASTATVDTSYWTIKPEITYEIIKDIKVINDVWIRDSIAKFNPNDTGHFGTKPIPIFGSGTRETQKVRFTVNYEKALPFASMQRMVGLSIKNSPVSNEQKYYITTASNVLSAQYEFICPNIIVRDSLGAIVTSNRSEGSYSQTPYKEVFVNASIPIPNSIRDRNNQKRISTSKELEIKLVE